jgi:hypothetical protein
VGTLDSSMGTGYVRRVSTSGAVETVISFSEPTTLPMKIVAASGATDVDLCWMVLEDTATNPVSYLLYGVASGEVLFHFYSETTSPIAGVRTTGPHEVFLVLQDGEVDRLDFPSSSGSVPSLVTVVGSTSSTAFDP